MLRITLHEDESPLRLQFEGKLAEPWIAEAEDAWRAAHVAGSTLVADLIDVITVDRAGWKLLEAMAVAGASFLVQGVKMKALIQEMKSRIKVDKA